MLHFGLSILMVYRSRNPDHYWGNKHVRLALIFLCDFWPKARLRRPPRSLRTRISLGPTTRNLISNLLSSQRYNSIEIWKFYSLYLFWLFSLPATAWRWMPKINPKALPHVLPVKIAEALVTMWKKLPSLLPEAFPLTIPHFSTLVLFTNRS